MNQANRIIQPDVPEEIDEEIRDNLYLSFSLNQEEYGIEIQHINEVVGLQEITVVPDSLAERSVTNGFHDQRHECH